MTAHFAAETTTLFYLPQANTTETVLCTLLTAGNFPRASNHSRRK